MWLDEPVVLSHQLVGTVVLVGDGSRTLSDRGYVSVVVVGVFVDVVAAVLVGGQQYYLMMVSMSNEVVMRTVPLSSELRMCIYPYYYEVLIHDFMRAIS